MDYGDHNWGLDRGYYKDPFPPFPNKNQTAELTLELLATLAPISCCFYGWDIPLGLRV